MAGLMRVDIYTHNFSVSEIQPSVRFYVEGYARKWIQYGFIKEAGRWIRQAIKGFYSITKDRSILRFHINQYEGFIRHLENNNIDLTMVDIVTHQLYEPERVELPVFDKWVTRPDQEPVVEYIVDHKPPRQKFVALQTGKGKTYCALRAASDLGYRLLIVVRPMYMDKWQEDVMKTYDIDFQDMVVVQGAASLIAVIDQAQNDELSAKVIVVSNKTLQPYIKLYEQFQDQIQDLGYGCNPYDLCQTLKVGTVIEDEIHQDFHLMFKLFTYTHVPKTISLSATLISDDDFVNNMYETTFPLLSRYQGGAYHKYVNATAILYQIKNPNKLRCQDYSRKTYSHTMFEESVMKNPYLLRNYLKLIGDLAEEHWLRNGKAGDRCLIYCARIEFCTIVTKYLKERFPSKDVRRYVEDDPYENIMTADMSVSTVGSAGTGLDIPDLTTVILTVAINSSASNIQGLGRLRDLPGRKTKFLYLCCEDIPKHRDYHERKRVLLQDRALTYNELKYPYIL